VDILGMLAKGFMVSLDPVNLAACALGVIIGTLAGVLPGIGPIGAIALLLPLSFNFDVTSSLILFAGIFYGAMFGGSTTSILLNVPGEAASIVTCIDGHAMARKGRAGAALAVAAIGSFIAGTMGLVGLTFFAPPLAELALVFGPPEYFAISVLGLVILARLTGGSPLKAALMVVVGIALGTVGMDGMTGVSRFTFEIDELHRGMEFVIIVMGLYGISEIISTMAEPVEKTVLQAVRFRELYPSGEEWRRSVGPIWRGGIIGFLVGLLPGPAATISTFISYAVEKRRSKQPEAFGHGAIEGVAGPESANNAAASATMIPLLSLGLPFTPASAILLSGFLLHGVTPGPTLVTEKPDLFWGMLASMYIGNVLLLIINLPLVGLFANILKTPMNILMPIVAMITITGAYAINNSIFDLWLLLIFGVLGFFLKKTGFEPTPLVIGLILGPTLERGLAQGLIIGNGDIWSIFTRPIAGTLLGIAAAIIIYNLIRLIGSLKGKRARQPFNVNQTKGE
jgi:putative tricarboxylic transport membrane protein